MKSTQPIHWKVNSSSCLKSIDEWRRDDIVTAATIVIRPNQQAEVDGKKPYADVRVRRAHPDGRR